MDEWNEVDDIESNFKRLNNKIDVLIEIIKTQRLQINNINNNVNNKIDISSKISELTETINKLIITNEKITDIEKKINDIDGKINIINTRINNISNININTKLNNLLSESQFSFLNNKPWSIIRYNNKLVRQGIPHTFIPDNRKLLNMYMGNLSSPFL